MTNKRTTRRTLIASLLVVALCFTMLIGTTFAWFTDSVTSASNVIQAGTLKVDIVDANDVSLAGEVIEFKTADNRDQSEILWEPGCTYVMEDFFIVNKGSLALKYVFEINGVNGNDKLLEALEWTVMVGDTEVDLDSFVGELYSATDAGKANKSEKIVITAHMKEDAGNEYQGLSISGIGITVYATQLAYENDSFDNQYDAEAGYPVNVSTADELADALVNGGNIILMNDIAVSATLPVENDTILNLNGYKLDASASNSRPLEITKDVTLTINAGDEEVAVGKYGLVNILASVTEAEVTINGGKFVGATDNGSIVKPRGTGDITINLNNVTVEDLSNNESWIVTGADHTGNLTVNVNGGSFTGFNGFTSAENLILTDVTMNMKHVAVVNSGANYVTVVDGCNITVTNEATAETNSRYPSAAVAASGNSKIVVKNSTLNGAKHATAVYTSGGNIVIENCTVNGNHAHYHDGGYYTNATFATTVDGVDAAVVYPNCPNGCNH